MSWKVPPTISSWAIQVLVRRPQSSGLYDGFSQHPLSTKMTRISFRSCFAFENSSAVKAFGPYLVETVQEYNRTDLRERGWNDCLDGGASDESVPTRHRGAADRRTHLDGLVRYTEARCEGSVNMRRDTTLEIVRLARSVEGAKVVVSSRTGDLAIPLEGFTALEIAPLSQRQVHDIAARWLSHPDDFLEALAVLPYHDIADRPLLLRQLLLLYQRYGFLPEQPAQVYKRVIRLLLEEWTRSATLFVDPGIEPPRVSRRARYVRTASSAGAVRRS
jgi:hypothetical protein